MGQNGCHHFKKLRSVPTDTDFEFYYKKTAFSVYKRHSLAHCTAEATTSDDQIVDDDRACSGDDGGTSGYYSCTTLY